MSESEETESSDTFEEDFQHPYVFCKREAPDGSTQFLVQDEKKEFQVWMSESEIIQFLSRRNKKSKNHHPKNIVASFKERHSFNPNFSIIEKIIAEKSGHYLVKWMDLDYTHLTLEPKSVTDKKAVNKFNQRLRLHYPSSKFGDNRALPKLGDNIIQEYTYNGIKFNFSQISCLNLLLTQFSSGFDVELLMNHGIDFYSPIIAFLDILYVQNSITGPFLFVSSIDNQKWYNFLKQIPNFVTICFTGSNANREIILKYDFLQEEFTKFHAIITTPYALRENISCLSKIDWAFALFEEYPNEQTFSDELIANFNIGTKVHFIHQIPINVADTSKILDKISFIKQARSSCHPNSNEPKYEWEKTDSEFNQNVERAEKILQDLIADNNFLSKDIPELEIQEIECPLSPLQCNSVLTYILDNQHLIKKKKFDCLSWILKMIISHPFSVNGMEHLIQKYFNQEGTSIDFQIISTKFSKLKMIISELISNKQDQFNILIISEFSQVLDLVEDMINESFNINVVRLDEYGNQNESQFEDTSSFYLWCPKYNNLMIAPNEFDYIISLDQLINPKSEFISNILSHRNYKYDRSINLKKVYFLSNSIEQMFSKPDDFCRLVVQSSLTILISINNSKGLIFDDNFITSIISAIKDDDFLQKNNSFIQEISSETFWDNITENAQKHLHVQVNMNLSSPENFLSLLINSTVDKKPETVKWSRRDRDQILRFIGRFGYKRLFQNIENISQDLGMTKDKACRGILILLFFLLGKEELKQILKTSFKEGIDFFDEDLKLFISGIIENGIDSLGFFGDTEESASKEKDRISKLSTEINENIKFVHHLKEILNQKHLLTTHFLHSSTPSNSNINDETSEVWVDSSDIKLIQMALKYGVGVYDYYENDENFYSILTQIHGDIHFIQFDTRLRRICSEIGRQLNDTSSSDTDDQDENNNQKEEDFFVITNPAEKYSTFLNDQNPITLMRTRELIHIKDRQVLFSKLQQKYLKEMDQSSSKPKECPKFQKDTQEVSTKKKMRISNDSDSVDDDDFENKSSKRSKKKVESNEEKAKKSKSEKLDKIEKNKSEQSKKIKNQKENVDNIQEHDPNDENNKKGSSPFLGSKIFIGNGTWRIGTRNEPPRNGEDPWSRSDSSKVFQIICNTGVDLDSNLNRDWNAFLKKTECQNKTPEQLKKYTEMLVSMAGIENEAIFPSTAQKIRMYVSTCDNLRFFLHNIPADFFDHVPLWKINLPEQWCGNHEKLLWETLRDNGFRTPKFDEIKEFQVLFKDNEFPSAFTKQSSLIARFSKLLHFFNNSNNTFSIESFLDKDPLPPTEHLMQFLQKNNVKLKLRKMCFNSTETNIEDQSPKIKEKPKQSFQVINPEVPISQVNMPLKLEKGAEIIEFGKIITDRDGFHTERYLYPAGFKSSRFFVSVKNPSEKSKYLSEILDSGGCVPIFRVTLMDDPNYSYTGLTPGSPWAQILKVLRDLETTFKLPASLSGPELFLLNNNTLYYFLQQMPEINQLSDFVLRDTSRIKLLKHFKKTSQTPNESDEKLANQPI